MEGCQGYGAARNNKIQTKNIYWAGEERYEGFENQLWKCDRLRRMENGNWQWYSVIKDTNKGYYKGY